MSCSWLHRPCPKCKVGTLWNIGVRAIGTPKEAVLVRCNDSTGFPKCKYEKWHKTAQINKAHGKLWALTYL